MTSAWLVSLLPGSWPGLTVFFAAWVVGEAEKASQLLFFTLGERVLVKVVSFRDFLKRSGLFTFLLKEEETARLHQAEHFSLLPFGQDKRPSLDLRVLFWGTLCLI